LYIRSGKSKAARRRLKLTVESKQILASRMSSKGPWVFPSPVDSKEHHGPTWQGVHDNVIEAMKGRRKSCEFVLYDLRHTFATRLCTQARVDLATAAKIMGHANLKSIEKYVHPSEEIVDRAMREYDQKCNTNAVPAANVIHIHPGGENGDQEAGVTGRVA
jgi:integrase